MMTMMMVDCVNFQRLSMILRF